MSEHAPDRFWSGIDIMKITAGTLAAVAAAVVGSYLGVAGTLAGAAVASVVGSVGTEVFQKSLSRGAARLRGTPTNAVAATPVDDASSAARAATAIMPAVPSPVASKARWRRAAIVAGAFFVLAMGCVSVVEAFAGEPVASMVGRSSTEGTTLFGTRPDSTPEPDVTPVPSAEPSDPPTGDVTDGPSTAPTTASPDDTDSAPQDPAPTGTAPADPAPTGPAPEQPGTGDEGTGDQGTGDQGTGDQGTGDEGTGDQGTGGQNREGQGSGGGQGSGQQGLRDAPGTGAQPEAASVGDATR